MVMSDLEIFQTMLGGGADLATIGFFYLVWRLDRRLLVIETFIADLRGN
jgi:hypothetical protein